MRVWFIDLLSRALCVAVKVNGIPYGRIPKDGGLLATAERLGEGSATPS